LGFISPTSIVALPEFNKFLVHYEMGLFSYPLDLVIRVSQGRATLKALDDSAERLAQNDGNVLFVKAGRVKNQTLGKSHDHIWSRSVSHLQEVVYATKTFRHVTLHMLELIRRDEIARSAVDRGSSYQTFGSVRLQTNIES
jgi:hypothetical protein